jgi:hypothetical protein
MRVAWFRPASGGRNSRLDDVAAVIAALRPRVEVEVFTAARTVEFEPGHLGRPFDTCVYELDDTAAHQFVWTYLLGLPGVLLLGGASLHNSRADALEREQRDEAYVAEFRFDHGVAPHVTLARRRRVPRGDWPMLRAPLTASRLTVVRQAALAAALEHEYPEARIRHVPVGVAPDPPLDPAAAEHSAGRPVIFGAIGDSHHLVLHRAFQRACDTGTAAELVLAGPEDPRLPACDVVVALASPRPEHAVVPALAGMAAGKPVVVLETAATADWPVLNPQSWQSRGFGSTPAPIAVSIDVLDEEHSLMLAMRRLAADPALRAELGAAAHAWWQKHATLQRAAGAWERTLDEAVSVAPVARPMNWPAHLANRTVPRGTDFS